MRDSDRLRAAARMINSVADALDANRRDGLGEHLDSATAQLRGLRRELFGPRELTGSARDRLAAHLTLHAGQWVQGTELAEVSGISAWARRLRELRADGWAISEQNGAYRLDEIPY